MAAHPAAPAEPAPPTLATGSLADGAAQKTAPAPALSPSAKPSVNPPVESAVPPGALGSSDSATPASVWSGLLQVIKDEPIFSAQMAHGTPLSWVGGVLVVEFPAIEFDLINAPSTLNKLRQYLQQSGHSRGELKLVAGAAPPPPVEVPKAPVVQRQAPKPPEAKPAKVQPSRLNKEEFLNDPAIRAAIEVFRAQLIEVRAPGESTAAS